jgi:hypothetical protein
MYKGGNGQAVDFKTVSDKAVRVGFPSCFCCAPSDGLQ